MTETNVSIGFVQYRDKKSMRGKGGGFTVSQCTSEEIMPIIVAELERRGYKTSYLPDAPKDRSGRRNIKLQ